MKDKIKEWQVQSNRLKVANLLMLDGVSFSYNKENGIVFSAPDSYSQENDSYPEELLRMWHETDYKRI